MRSLAVHQGNQPAPPWSAYGGIYSLWPCSRGAFFVRNLTAGQKAMAHALMYPDPARLKRKADVDSVNIDRAYLSRARAILNHEDPTAFIFSTNIARRHLTAGQKAMAHALMYPEGQQGKRTDLEPVHSVNKLPVSKAYLSNARAVIPYPDLVSMVMAGKSLNDAYTTGQVWLPRPRPAAGA